MIYNILIGLQRGIIGERKPVIVEKQVLREHYVVYKRYSYLEE